MAQKPATPSGVMGASVPPAIMIVGVAPGDEPGRRRRRRASRVAQAVTEAEFGPLAP